MTSGICTNNEDCLNGGICRRGESGSFRCNCPTGYWGDRCDPICSLPCKNGGYCVRSNGMGGVKCLCLKGFEGDLCEDVSIHQGASINQDVPINQEVSSSHSPSLASGYIIVACATSAVWIVILLVSLILCRRRNHSPHHKRDLAERPSENHVDKVSSYKDNEVENTDCELVGHTIT
jgi:hypothetical protein